MANVVVGEVPGIAAVADDKKLQEAEQGFVVAVAGVVLVIDDLLHGVARADFQRLEFDLHDRQAVDEQNHVIAMVAVLRIDAQLVDHLEGVLAPVLDIDQGVVKRSTVVALETVPLTQVFGYSENVLANRVVPRVKVNHFNVF